MGLDIRGKTTMNDNNKNKAYYVGEIRQNLDSLIDEVGLKHAWISILAAHVGRKSGLEYIAKSKELENATPLKYDMIEGLSVGEVGVLYEYSIAKADSSSRKKKGQFFTPDDAAKFIVRQTINFPSGVWFDPCCGVGNLAWHLVAIQDNPEEFVMNRMKFADIDPLALLIARVLIVSSFQKNYPSLFYDIADNFFVSDFLANGATPDKEAQWDFIIMNPPYAATKQDSRFTSSSAGDLYAYFLERAMLTSRGFVAVTPQSFTNAGKFSGLRKVLLASETNLTIYAFDNVPGNFFKGYKFGSTNSNTTNSVRAAVIVVSPVSHNEIPSRRITSLIRWRGVERKRVFSEAELFLSEPILSEKFFPKVGAPLEGLYDETKNMPVLSSLVNIEKELSTSELYVPSIPRYFISALKTPVSRTSQRKILFDSDNKRDIAYLLLNSSLAYWWWRIRDGGMNLSLTTLMSVPVPNFVVDPSLIEALEWSEKNNRVYKKNAGVVQENVKHPLNLIAQVNKAIIPIYADALLKTHENSEFVQID